ncbi:MAG: hypothetical protein ACXVB0_09355 [Mucilaginibacter sp.]
MDALTKSSLYSGLILFILCSLSFIGHVAVLLIGIAFLFPGFVFGYILASEDIKSENGLRGFILMILSGLIYIGCFEFLDLDHDSLLGLRLLALSGIGALLLKLCYDLIISKRLNIKETILIPLIIGVIAAIPSSICTFFINRGSSTIQNLCYCGLFLIYPIWYYCFAAYINHCKKRVALLESSY